MDGVLTYALSGVIFGLSSGIAPGPLLTLTISETLRHGIGGGLRIAFAPMLTDAPLILITFFFLTQLEGMETWLGIIALAGGSFLLWMAWECMTMKPPAPDEEPQEIRSLMRGILTNLLNPAPYMFWISVGTPTLIEAKKSSALSAWLYLLAFFSCIVLSKVVVALLTARFRDFLRSTAYVWLMRILGLALAFFATIFLHRAAVLLGRLAG